MRPAAPPVPLFAETSKNAEHAHAHKSLTASKSSGATLLIGATTVKPVREVAVDRKSDDQSTVDSNVNSKSREDGDEGGDEEADLGCDFAAFAAGYRPVRRPRSRPGGLFAMAAYSRERQKDDTRYWRQMEYFWETRLGALETQVKDGAATLATRNAELETASQTIQRVVIAAKAEITKLKDQKKQIETIGNDFKKSISCRACHDHTPTHLLQPCNHIVCEACLPPSPPPPPPPQPPTSTSATAAVAKERDDSIKALGGCLVCSKSVSTVVKFA